MAAALAREKAAEDQERERKRKQEEEDAKAESKIAPMLDQLDAELARHGQPWLLGERYSVADAYAFVLCRWTRGFARPARSLPHLRPWLERMLARPAVQRAFATEQLAPPWV